MLNIFAHILAAGLAIAAFCAGYTIRDSGYKFGATQTPTTQEIQK